MIINNHMSATRPPNTRTAAPPTPVRQPRIAEHHTIQYSRQGPKAVSRAAPALPHGEHHARRLRSASRRSSRAVDSAPTQRTAPRTLRAPRALRSAAALLIALKAAGTLLALAMLLIPPAAAQAQTDIWSGTLTAKDLTSGILGCSSSVSVPCSSSSNLSDDDFTYGGTDYSIHFIQLRTNGQLQLAITPHLTGDARNLTFDVAGTLFAFQDANSKNDDATNMQSSRYWSSSGLSWTVNSTVALKLTSPTTTTNAAPTASDKTVTTNEDTDYTFAAADFNFADTDTGDAAGRSRRSRRSRSQSRSRRSRSRSSGRS